VKDAGAMAGTIGENEDWAIDTSGSQG